MLIHLTSMMMIHFASSYIWLHSVFHSWVWSTYVCTLSTNAVGASSFHAHFHPDHQHIGKNVLHKIFSVLFCLVNVLHNLHFDPIIIIIIMKFLLCHLLSEKLTCNMQFNLSFVHYFWINTLRVQSFWQLLVCCI